MGRRIGVGGIEEFLDAEKDLLDGDGGFPAFFFVENGKTDCAGGVDVGVEERWCEFALWRFGWVFIRKDNIQLEKTSLP